MQRCTPSIVQSCRPATPRAQPSHTPLVSTSQRVLGVAAVGPGHLGHVAVVVRLLQPDAVGPPAHPPRPAPPGELLTQAHWRPPGVHVAGDDAVVDADEAGEREPGLAGRLDGEGRRRAHRDHRAEPGGPGLLHDLEAGPPADVEAEVGRGQRARRAGAGRPPCRRRCGGRCPRAPASGSPVRSNAAAACTAPVRSNRSWSGRTRSGTAASTSMRPGRAAPAIGAMRARRSSIDVEPHSPHADVVVATPRLGHRRGAAGVDAHDVELALHGAARAAVAAR